MGIFPLNSIIRRHMKTKELVEALSSKVEEQKKEIIRKDEEIVLLKDAIRQLVSQKGVTE